MHALRLRACATALACLSIGILGCGSNNGSSGPDGVDLAPGELRIEPPEAFLEIETGVEATQLFKVYQGTKGGGSKDVTSEVLFDLQSDWLGTMSGSVFTTSEHAGKTTLTAHHGTGTATAAITVKLNHIIVEPGTPADAPDQFAGATPGGEAPELVYPGSGVMLPPNLSELEIHYLPGGQNNLFELDISSDLIGLKIYMTCEALNEGCLFLPSEETWQLIAEASRGKDTFMTVRGLSGSTVGTSATNTMSFTRNDLYGGIYYWNSGGSIMRYDFGRRGQAAETFLNAAEAGGTTCVGCHSISRDGTKIAVGVDIPSPAAMRSFEVDTKAMNWSDDDGANFYTFSPDNSQILTSNGISIDLRNATTGEKVGDAPVIAEGSMPDWSADGTRVVFSRSTSPPPCLDGSGGGIPGIPGFPGFPGGGDEGGLGCATPGHDSGSIVIVDANTWNNEQTLVRADGLNNFYPAFTPDSQWVIFNRSPTNKDSMDTDDAQLWAVSANGGAEAIKLANATSGITDSWPKASPYIHQYGQEDVYWFTFSSKRDFGLRLKNSEMSYDDESDPRTAQVWMAAFSPSRALAGQDASWVAFRVPFQDLGTGNHIAQWVEQIGSEPCSEDTDCPFGEFCSEGWCQPVPVGE
jgi:hypothetical protein